MRYRKIIRASFVGGSTLILTVVLTSLLAIIGMLFVIGSRVDRISTSAVTENKELDLAVNSIIAKLAEELIKDVTDPNEEYRDYPDPCDAWLAALEPTLIDDSDDPTDDIYQWRQISDVTGFIAKTIVYDFDTKLTWDTKDIVIKDNSLPVSELPKPIIDDRQEIILNAFGHIKDVEDVLGQKKGIGQLADADGDGVADSKWIELTDDELGLGRTSKGKRIYAAVRVIDNSAMLNVNTGYEFDPDDNDPNRIDGSSQMQVNLMALANRGIPPTDDQREDLRNARANYDVDIDADDLDEYEKSVIWQYNGPNVPYTPFDISDELELRNRFLINHSDVATRLELVGNIALPQYTGGAWEFRVDYSETTPFNRPSDLDEWLKSSYDTGNLDPNYAYRHISTTYNIDRVIDPDLDKMININRAADTEDPNKTYQKLLKSVDFADISSIKRREIEKEFAQLAVNLADFADNDDKDEDDVLDGNCVSVLDVNDKLYFGFEAQPFISELGIHINTDPAIINRNYYAVELYNPFDKVIDLNDFALDLIQYGSCGPPTVTIPFRPGHLIQPYSTFVIVNDTGGFQCYGCSRCPGINCNLFEYRRLEFFMDWVPPDKTRPVDESGPDSDRSRPPVYIGWEFGYDVHLKRKVRLQRRINGKNWAWVYVDKQMINPSWGVAGYDRFPYRDIRDWHIAYPTMVSNTTARRGSLGRPNRVDPDEFENRGHYFSFFMPNPYQPRSRFTTVGEISRMLSIGSGNIASIGNSTLPCGTIPEQLIAIRKDEEEKVRLDLQNPLNSNVFQYLTVFDPNERGSDANEARINGRININTAPWYVLAQLPWVSDRGIGSGYGDEDKHKLAQAIVAYRDKLPQEAPPGLIYDEKNRSENLGQRIKEEYKDDIRLSPGFESIGELNFVLRGDDEFRIDYYAQDNQNLSGFPDLTTLESINGITVEDELEDDFEERDIIFSRISNLVSVRSDVFTAYILVRFGHRATDPQKRVIAILDRSEVTGEDGRVKVYAYQNVPDPR
ncbi:ComEA family DNA-binding protein [Planctomycetota bacterium]